MKRKITFLSAALMLLAFLAVPLGMCGQTRTEEVYSTCLFGPNYNSAGVSSYTSTFTATNGDFSWTIVNGNNNNNQWNYVKFGRKNNASVGSITTTVNYGQAITKVDLTIDAITADKVNSITLYTSSDNNTWDEAGSFDKATGLQTATLATPATGLYYKIELDCASGSANGLVTVSKVEYYYNSDGPSAPTITASNIELAYDATEGSIAYTINNPMDNGSIAASTESEWLYVDEEAQNTSEGSFDLLCDPNTGDARMATVTLTYTYGEESITKDVTVTQAAAPVVYTTIPDLFAAATSTETNVLVNFNSWVVSGVSTNGKNVFVTDNEGNGFVIYSSSNMSNIYSVGNILSGEISCSLKLYNGFAELLNVNAEDLTITEGGTVTEAAIEMADLTGVNTGALLHYDNLTCSVSSNKYYLTDGTTTLQVYNALYAFDALTDGATYNITGIYQQYNSTKEILPRSADDIEEVVAPAEPFITVEPDLVEAPAAGEDGTLSITLSNMTISDDDQLDIVYYYATGEQITNQEDIPNWLECIIIEENEAYVVYYSIGQSTNTEEQTAYFKVYGIDDDGTTEAYSNIVTITQDAYVAPVASITVTPDEVTLDAGQHLVNYLDLAYENIEVINYESFAVHYYNADGEEIQLVPGEAWMLASVVKPEDVYQVFFTVMANEGEARTAYFKVSCGETYSNLVTITQDAIDYAILPFHWNGGTKDELLANQGVTASGLGTNYAASNAPYRVKFDGTGDYIQVKTNTNPDYVTIGVKMLGGSDTSTITVQASAEGETFDEGEVLTISGNQNDILNLATTRSFDESVRYIRLYFTKGSNVGVGPISIGNYETYNLHVTGYDTSETDGYVLLASPVYVNPDNVEGMTEGNFDLYYFDQSEVGFEWRNYEEEGGHFNLVPGKGYLYAHDTDVELTFTGIPYSGDGIIQLSFDADYTWGDENYYWNLVGNPFGETAYIDRDFYAMNETGTDIMTDASQGAVEAMQGVFVIAEEDGETLTFTAEAPTTAANVTLNLSQNRGAVIDRTIVRFGEGRQLPKFQLNAESTKLYIPQGNNDYAVVRSAASGEMPVNFKAQNNGTYTLSVNAENVEVSYLHLIDNMTGADIDLLATPSYSFEAKTTDYTSRFRLVFNITSVEENTTSTETFAFFNGSEWVISNTGKATLQVVDVLGRIISSETVNGNATINTNNFSNGVYVMRLTNGNDVKTQKIVVR